nr:MAG TPA: hypothetical protein [Caudoviricetes sp.]
MLKQTIEFFPCNYFPTIPQLLHICIKISKLNLGYVINLSSK